MNEPVGWRWIEAWRKGTIDEQEFQSLQKLLRDDPEARRTLRRAMALDTALRDRAESGRLAASVEPAVEPPPTRAVSTPRSRFTWREAFAWTAALAGALAAVAAWYSRPTTNRPPQETVAVKPSLPSPASERRAPAAAEPMISEQRDRLLASAPDVLHLPLVGDDGKPARTPAGGDIVWSDGRQIGYLRLARSPRPGSPPAQYHLWIVGCDMSGNEIIKAGAFVADPSQTELILPIQPDQFVQQPKMFVVSAESSEDATDWVAPLLAKVEGARP